MTVVGVTQGQLSVERAMVATLELWLPEYIVAAARRYAAEAGSAYSPAEIEAMLVGYAQLLADPDGEHEGLPYKPKTITVAASFEDWRVDALPHVQVLSPSWAVAGGSQNGKAIDYSIHVACMVGAAEHDDTRLIRACYEDAIVGLVDQHQSLGGISAGVRTIGGGPAEFNEVSEADSQTLQGSIAAFVVTVQDVIDSTAGPIEPIEPGPGVPPVQPPGPIFEGDADAELEPSPVGDPL